eukprot:1155763-Rhodomonas_salina.1
MSGTHIGYARGCPYSHRTRATAEILALLAVPYSHTVCKYLVHMRCPVVTYSHCCRGPISYSTSRTDIAYAATDSICSPTRCPVLTERMLVYVRYSRSVCGAISYHMSGTEIAYAIRYAVLTKRMLLPLA